MHKVKDKTINDCMVNRDRGIVVEYRQDVDEETHWKIKIIIIIHRWKSYVGNSDWWSIKILQK